MQPTQPDASKAFATHFASCRYEDIDPAAIEIARKSLLDTLGVSIAAGGLDPDAGRLAEIALAFPSPAGCRVIGFPGRVAAPAAAWVNGGLAHSLDFDDIGYDSFTHPSSAVLAAVLAAAEHVGGVSGKELLASLALGQDMVIRLSLSLDWGSVLKLPWLPFPLMGCFASAAAAARILRLDEAGIHAAISIALAHASGAGELMHGSLRGLYSSWAAQGGLHAALMARAGVRGPLQPLEGSRGFFAVYWNGAYDRKPMVDQLGVRFENLGTGFKPWPSCSVTHPPIDATLSLRQDHAVEPQRIERITVRVSQAAALQSEPLDQKRRPATSADAKFSIPFCVAVAASHGAVLLDHFKIDALRDPEVLSLADRVLIDSDPSLKGSRGVDPSVVEFTLTDGQKTAKRVDIVRGHHRNPISFQNVADKFASCARHSRVALPADRVQAVVETVARIETLPDAAALMDFVCG
jgi:2-methylcitrate dehydratase PrpD